MGNEHSSTASAGVARNGATLAGPTHGVERHADRTLGGLVMICDVDLELPDATRTHTLEVARGFVAEGLHVQLVTRGSDPRLPNVRHHRMRGSETGHVYRIVYLNIRSLVLLCTARRSAGRCYVRNKWSNVAILLAARLLGYRLVTQVDDVDYHGDRSDESEAPFVAVRVKRLAATAMGRLAHGVVAVTPQIKALLVEQFHTPAEKIAVLPNGVDIDFFHPLPRAEAIARTGLDPHCRYAVFCGNFQPWVDFAVLLPAFSLVAAAVSDARLILIGDGPERRWIEEEIDRLGIGESVQITGFVRERATVRDLLAAATVTLSANTWKHRSHVGVSPVKLAEYMACGRAVVATELPGLRDAIEAPGAGVVKPADAQAVSEAIVALLDPERADALGANGRRLAEELYSWRSIVRRTLPLFGI